METDKKKCFYTMTGALVIICPEPLQNEEENRIQCHIGKSCTDRLLRRRKLTWNSTPCLLEQNKYRNLANTE